MPLALKKEHLPHYTYDDYCRWEGNWELIEGVPYAMSPLPTSKHQRLAGKLYSQLDGKLQQCKHCEVSLPVDWKIGEATVVQPDLFVACFDFIIRMWNTSPIPRCWLLKYFPLHPR